MALANSTAFYYGAHFLLIIPTYEGAALSVPALNQPVTLVEKDLLRSGSVEDRGKYTLLEHLDFMLARQSIGSDRPLMALGARNNLVNLRCPVIMDGQYHAVEGECPEQSRRPYYGIGLRGNRLECDSVMGDAPSGWDFFCAGVPVLWDDLDEAALFDLILSETADHSHIFQLPRGNHPAATDATRAAWEMLHQAFVAELHSDETVAVAALHRGIRQCQPPLQRCDDYLHAAVGVRDDGALVALFAQARLEALGRALRGYGCRRAVVLENSGSVMPTFLPKGRQGDMIPLLRAPNFRPRGRTLIFVELADGGFTASPLTL